MFFNLLFGFIVIISTSIISSQISPIISSQSIHHPVIGNNGMVASQEANATNVGIDILKNGGNAIDAAVAVGFALAVTLPQAGNLGGGGFMLIHIASENRTVALDFREMAPEKSTKTMFLNADGTVNKQRAWFSPLSSGVPGSVHGLLTALTTFGTMSRKQVINPAINLAKYGFTVSPTLYQSLKQASPRLEKWPYTRSLFTRTKSTSKHMKKKDNQKLNKQFEPVQAGSNLKQPDLAKSLQRIKKHGISGFYNGPTAEKIALFMKNNNGLITKKDLNNYQTIIRKPTSESYHGTTIYSMPPPSSGGIILLQILKLIEPFPIKDWGHNSAKTIHVMTEAMGLAYADRAEWLGDEDFVDVPKKKLLSHSYLEKRRQTINLSKHTESKLVKHGSPYESHQTTHYSIVDKWGNAVSVTTTLNFSYGSGIAVPGTGILLNNEMDDFSSKPGIPNAYGLIGNKRNAIAPKKRMLSSMSPTIVLKDSDVLLVTGSPGGSRIITTVAQIISNVVDHSMNIAEATHAPRFHFQWLPDTLQIESQGFSKDTLSKLKDLGHKINIVRSMGSTQSIVKKNNYLYGASDPRKPGALTKGLN